MFNLITNSLVIVVHMTVPFHLIFTEILLFHCLKRKAEGEKLESSCVISIDSHTGKFQVKGRGEQPYFVSFGFTSLEEMPSCSCPDFTKHFSPCKHFFAIFHWHDYWTWNSLPSSYLSSPYMSIDWPAIHQYFADRNFNVSTDATSGPIVAIQDFEFPMEDCGKAEVTGETDESNIDLRTEPL